MIPPKVDDEDYIQFLMAIPKVCSATEAARVQLTQPDPPAHDSFTRLLTRMQPDSLTLWGEAQAQVQLTEGALILDDSTLDKPYARSMDLVPRHWSGKHHAVVQGINLTPLLWTDGDRPIPCDYRIYDKEHDGATKNDHFRNLLQEAKNCGFRPKYVVFDGWYCSLDNLKLIRSFQWFWLTRFKANRLVNRNREGLRPLSETEIASSGTEVHLKGYGLVMVFKMVAPNGDMAYWGTNDLSMKEWTRLQYAQWSWKIEEYHRGIKQYWGVEKGFARKGIHQRNHIGLAIRAFLRLEGRCFVRGISWFHAKMEIIRDALRSYWAKPTFLFVPVA
jgi:putative transposase